MIRVSPMRKLRPSELHDWLIAPNKLSAKCLMCGYKILIDHSEETQNGSRHVPLERTIYVDVPSLKKEQPAHLADVWGVACKR